MNSNAPPPHNDASLRDPAADSALLAELLLALGAEDFQYAVEQFESDTKTTLDGLASLSLQPDEALISKAVHRLKGLFLQFGAETAGTLAKSIEALPANERWAATLKLCQFAPQAVQAVVAESQKLVRTL